MSKPHSDEERAAVMAALLAGQGVNEVAAAYNVPKSTVWKWQSNASGEMRQRIRQQQQHNFDELVGTYLAESLKTLAVQVRFFRDPEWLRKQEARDLAVLHGVLTDKAVRILEAAELARGDEEPAGGGETP